MKIKKIIKDAKSLNSKERAFVAHCLISSLETKQEEGVDFAWAEIAEKRYDELISGKVKAVSWGHIKENVKS